VAQSFLANMQPALTDASKFILQHGSNENQHKILYFRLCLRVSSSLGENNLYRGAGKSLARPGRKQATATEDFDVHISYL